MPDGRVTRCRICKEWEHESAGCDCTTDLDCPCGLRAWTKIDDEIVCWFCRNLGEDDGYTDGLAGRLPQRLDHTESVSYTHLTLPTILRV